MPNYDYTARDGAGNTITGTIQAENDFHLRDQLRSSQIYLVSFIKQADSSERSRDRGLVFGVRKVKLGDMVVFSRQLTTLIEAGLPIVEALGILSAQTENVMLAEAISELRLQVLSGATLSQAMRSNPKVFNDLFISLVEAGEAGGVLEQTLEVAAVQFDKEATLREQVKTAMAYPKIVVVACVGVVAFMLAFIVPAFAKVYAGFHAKLPAMTLLLMTVSNIVVHWWWAVLIVGVALFFGYRRFSHTTGGRRTIDQATLRIPILGKVLRKIAVARFVQTWAGATRGGINILSALAISANTSGNVIIRDAVFEVARKVQEGSPTAPALDQTGQFPPMVTRMIAAGERSGNLDHMLDEIARFYQRDIDYSVQRMTRLMEPMMTVIVGGVVLFVLLGLYMPIFTLTQVIKK